MKHIVAGLARWRRRLRDDAPLTRGEREFIAELLTDLEGFLLFAEDFSRLH
jgi:hypothetical protein